MDDPSPSLLEEEPPLSADALVLLVTLVLFEILIVFANTTPRGAKAPARDTSAMSDISL